MGDNKPKNPLDVFWEQLGDKEKNMSEATDPINVIYKIQREMKTQLESLVQTLANGELTVWKNTNI